jgi:D-threo-aldose 1-dehydrogenase
MIDPLATTALAGAGVALNRLGVGLAPIGGLYTPVGAQQARDTVDRAWDLGLRFFDTAPFYGYGLSELRVGAALAGRAGYTLSTKVGRVLAPTSERDGVWADSATGLSARFDFSAAGVRRSLEDSLERLDVAGVDLVHLHDPDGHLAQAAAEAYPELVRARDEGLVRAIGVGTNSADVASYLMDRVDLDVVLLAGRYTLLDRSGLALLDRAAERGVAVIAAGVFNSGLLADPRPGATYDYGPADDALLGRALQLRQICQQYDVPLRAAAINWPARHPAVASVLVGVRSAAEVEDALAMTAVDIPESLWDELSAR